MELKDRSFMLVDVETTGFDEKKHQILEVGIIIIKNMQVVADIDVAIKHKEYTLTSSAMAANKIDILRHEEIALTPEDAAIKILSFLKEYKDEEGAYIAIGQNVDFDLKFLEAMFLQVWKIKEYREFISYRKLDIMQVAILKNIEGKINIEKQDLDTLLKTLEIDIPLDRHRALADCYLEFEVLKKLLNLQ